MQIQTTTISRLQFIYLMTWLIMGTGVLTLPYSISQFVVRDAWMSAVLIFAMPLVASGITALYIRTFSTRPLVEGFHTAFGPWLGRLASMWLLVWLYALLCMIVRELCVFVEVGVLPQTPIYVISALVVFPVAITTSWGFEVMGRLSEILTPLAVIVTLALFGLAVQHADIHRLTPVLADGWTPVLRGTVIPWTWAMELVIALQFVQSLSNGGRYLTKDLLIVGAVLMTIGVVAEVTITSILGPQRTYSLFPILEVIRTIRYGDFLERLDPLYVMGVTSLILLKLSTFQYAWLSGLQQWLRCSSYRPLVWSGAFAVWTGSLFLWPDAPTMDEYILFTLPGYFAVTLIVLPLAAIVVYRIRKSLGTRLSS